MPPQLLFATPLWSFEFPKHLEPAVSAKEVLRLREQDPAGLQITNQGGWHSRTNLLDHAPLAPLFQWLAASCQQALGELGWDFSLARPKFNNAWAMVNGCGHSVRAHLHPNSLMSGVVYLQAQEHSGNIAFLDPRNGAQVLLPPLQNPQASLLNGRHEIAPRPGLMLLFPAWLWHEVGANTSQQERICISFNIGMQAVNPASPPGVLRATKKAQHLET